LPELERIERVAFRVAVLLWVGFALVGAWEIASPLPYGHYGAGAAFTIAGEQMAHWKIFATVFPYTPGKPQLSDYYAHHPWGMTYVSAALYQVVGHQWLATRLPAVVFSAFTPPLLYLVARALWGILPAAIASIMFVLVPIDLAFCAFWNLEVPTIFFGLVFTLGTVRFFQTWKTRWMLLSVFGAFCVTHIDWVGAVLVGAVAAFAFVRAYVLPRRRYGRIHERQHVRWFAFIVAAVVGTILFYVVVFSRDGRMQDLMDGYNNRVRGLDEPIRSVLRGRRLMWILWMLTPIGLWTAGLGLAASIRQLQRDPLGIVLPAWAVATLFEYFVFKQAADTHIFWPHQAGACIALGAGAVMSALLEARSLLIARLSRKDPARDARVRRISAVACYTIVLVPVALMARVGVSMLWQARVTAGTFDQGGRRNDTERDHSIFAKWTSEQLKDRMLVAHRSFGGTLNVAYAAERVVAVIDKVTDPPPKDVVEGAFMMDARYCSPGELRDVVARWQVTAVGPMWRVDRTKPASPIVAMHYEERLPRGAEVLTIGSDLVRTIGHEEDAWASWEWRNHFAQAAPPPRGEPTTFDEVRVAHNLAVDRGDGQQAAALFARLTESLTERRAFDYEGDFQLVGYRLEDGVLPVLTLLWRVGPSFVPFDGLYLVHSRITQAPLLWPTVVDRGEKETAPPQTIGPPFWRPGFVYAHRFLVQRRAGAERLTGFFQALAEGGPPMPGLKSAAPRALLVDLR
jgi:hypothetical protein